MGVNYKSREVFRIFMKRAPKRKAKVEDPDADRENPHEVDLIEDGQLLDETEGNEAVEGVAKWRVVTNPDVEDGDDVTSDGDGYTKGTLTPSNMSSMSPNRQRGCFVPAFEGELYKSGLTPKQPHAPNFGAYSINDDNGGNMPSSAYNPSSQRNKDSKRVNF